MTDGARTSRIRRPANRSSRTLSVAVSGCTQDLSDLLERVARHTLLREGARRGQLHIALVDDTEMCRQHARWMNDPTTTDVLTFDLRDNANGKAVDGQLIVCRSVARRAARGLGHTWQQELALYVVHGCLHLSGYDDHTAHSAARMHRREDELLSELGVGPVFDPKAPRRSAREIIRDAAPRPALNSGERRGRKLSGSARSSRKKAKTRKKSGGGRRP